MLLTIIFPIKDPDDSTIETLRSLINQSYTSYVIKIFFNEYKKENKEFIKKNWELFKHKRIEFKTFKKNYGQLSNVKKGFRNINTKYFMLTTNGIIYEKKYLQKLIKPFKYNQKLVLSVCEFAIRNSLGDYIAVYPKTKPKKNKINSFENHYNFLRGINSAGTKINGIFKSKILKDVKMIKNLDWDKLFLYQVSLLGEINIIKNIYASKLVRKNLIQDMKIVIDDQAYNSLVADKQNYQFYFHHRQKIKNGKNQNILVTHSWVSSHKNLSILDYLIYNLQVKPQNVTIKYFALSTLTKQLFSNYYKVKPKYLRYYEFYNLLRYTIFLFSILGKNKNFFYIKNIYWTYASIKMILLRKKIFSFKKSSFLRLDNLRYRIVNNFFMYKKKSENRILYTAVRKFNDRVFYQNKLSGAIKSSENILKNLVRVKNKIDIYYPPKKIPENPFTNQNIKKISSSTIRKEYYKIQNNLLKNKYYYIFFQKTLDYQYFRLLKSKKKVLVSHNIEYLHYFKKKYLNIYVHKIKKRLIVRNKSLNDNISMKILLFISIYKSLKIKSLKRVFKEFINNFKIYIRADIIIKTYIVESVFDKIFKKKTFLYAPVVYDSIKLNSTLIDEKFIYLSCIGAGNGGVYGDFQVINFINFLKSNYNYIFANQHRFKLMISGVNNYDVVNFLKLSFNFLECKIILPSDNLNDFLNDHFIVNFIIDDNTTGVRTKFYDNFFAGNVCVFDNIKQSKTEVFYYEKLINTKLIFDIENKNNLMNFLEELKHKDLKKIKKENKVVAQNYNQLLKENNNLCLTFINGLD